jgi:hypothetical protein
MKRTNLIIDEVLLRKAKKLLEADSFSATVNEALAAVIRLKAVQSMTTLFGKGVWEGDLAKMRDDVVKRPRRAKAG